MGGRGAPLQADGLWASLVRFAEEGHARDAVAGPERLEHSSDTGWAAERNSPLAILMAEGLTDRRTATVPRTGEDAVAGDESGQLPRSTATWRFGRTHA